MDMIRKILVYILTAAVMVTSAGIVVFHSFCSCTGDEYFTLYITPETCTENYHIHHKHNDKGEERRVNEGECHDCNFHTSRCGCNNPGIELYKLDDRILNENIRIEKVQPVLLKILYDFLPLSLFFSNNDDFKELLVSQLPPGIQRSLDFLIFIQQIKIPLPF